MSKQSLEEFQKRLKKQRERMKAQIDAAGQEQEDDLVPYVLLALESMKLAGWTSAPLRNLMTTMVRAGAPVGKDEYNRVQDIVGNVLGLHISNPFPTVFQMPFKLPVIQDGEIIEPAVLADPEATDQ